jgi:hypothetical protein
MTDDDHQPLLGARFEDALAFAARVHRSQLRKGGEIPYVGHLLGVCSLVIEDGGTEDKAIKLYNARAIRRDYELEGERVWERFNRRAGRDGQLWYYDELATRFSELYPSPMATELREVVDRLSEAAVSS